jgi:nucleotide-binding universal stress UspA family protein
LRWASERAASLGAELHTVTAVLTPMPVGLPAVSAVCFPDRERLVQSALELQNTLIDEVLPDEALRPEITQTVRTGEPFRVLKHEASDADLVVLGRARRGLFRSLTARCLKSFECPVVVVDGVRPC